MIKRVKTLPPLTESPFLWHELSEYLLKLMVKEIYQPLIEVITHDDLGVFNSIEKLAYWVARGRIQYVDGHFEGRITPEISRALRKIGANYNGRKGYWSMPYKELPQDIRVAIGTSASRFQAMGQRAKDALSKIIPEKIAEQINPRRFFDDQIFKLDRQFKGNVKKIGIVPDLTPDMREQIAQAYTKSTKLDIKSWADKEIRTLRDKVEKHTLQSGLRREALVDEIQKRYGVTSSKAKFLARQESNLLIASFQEKRYLDAGLPRYQWYCMNMPPAPEGSKPRPHQVRPDHWELNGKIFLWSSPPVVDHRTGRRGHPKTDYGCRCTAIPIYE